MKVAALIPAAGLGERLGRGPKAFVEVGGKTLLERAVSAFLPLVDEVVVAVSAEMRDRALELVGGSAAVVLGGATRQESVYNLLQRAGADIVLLHDAARPFLPAAVARAVIEAAARTGAATAMAPVADTVIVAETGETLDRHRLRAVQTPQGFRRDLILEAHRCALAQGVQATDDAALVRRLGHDVTLVPGSSWLMKITTHEDLILAEAMAALWDEIQQGV